MTVPWLWLYGPPGVGKSATGYELFDRLATGSSRVAYVELDQIGMCMGASTEERSAAKVDNLLGMLDGFAAAGADGVIVSGDVAETMRTVLTRAPVRPLLCRLRADDAVTRERLSIRGGMQYAMSSSAYEAFDVPDGDLDIATAPLGVREVADEILRRLGPWPPASVGSDVVAPGLPAAFDDTSAILITGPRAVGTSTVAWQVLMASVGSGRRTGYLDLEQLGFLPPALEQASRATKLANVAVCWAGFRRQGAERVVLCGHVHADALGAVRALLPSVRVVALAAAPETLLARADRRRRQKDVWLPGDDLYGCDDAHVRRVALAGFDPGHADLDVTTDQLTPPEIAARISPHWPDAR